MGRIRMLRPNVGSISIATAAPLRMGEHVRLGGYDKKRLDDAAMKRARGLCECPECRLLPRPLPAEEIDHILPLWEGGAEDLANRQALNKDCHKRKTAAEARRRMGISG